MMRAEEECGEKRQRGVEKKLKRQKYKLWAQSKKAQRRYYKNKIESTSLPWWKLYKSPLKKMMNILGVALPTKDMFDTLDSHFEGIHSLTSKAQPEETTLQAEIATSEYIKFYRQCFPNRILKKNSTDFMHRTGFGLGFLRGQDGNNFTQLFHAWQEVQP